MTLESIRRAYADGIATTAQVRTPGLADAFAAIPRERFLGAGPAQVVGPQGHVMAVEIDAELAARARTKLAKVPQVSVLDADGIALPPGRYATRSVSSNPSAR